MAEEERAIITSKGLVQHLREVEGIIKVTTEAEEVAHIITITNSNICKAMKKSNHRMLLNKKSYDQIY